MTLDILLENPENLSFQKRQAFSGLLTTKQGLRILEGRNPLGIKDSQLFLAGGYLNDELVACCAFSLYPSIRACDLHYLFVKQEFRFKGFGRDLLDFLARYLKERSIHVCWARYLLEDEFTPIFQHLFSKLGWGPPFHEKETYYFDPEVFNPPWFSKNDPLPQGCTLFLWSELTDREREKILEMERQRTFPLAVSPLRSKYAFESLNSLGIRYGEDVIGWMITHRLKKDLIQYSSLFVRQDFRLTPCWSILLIEALRIHKRASPAWGSCVVNPSEVFPTWRRFARSQLKPYAQKVENLYVSTLEIDV